MCLGGGEQGGGRGGVWGRVCRRRSIHNASGVRYISAPY